MIIGQFVFFLKARKIISKGCIYHLVQVKDSRSKTLSLDLVPMVKEFLKVFPKDLLGFFPKKDIDLRIDLLPDLA